jgi:hypothetical protein
LLPNFLCERAQAHNLHKGSFAHPRFSKLLGVRIFLWRSQAKNRHLGSVLAFQIGPMYNFFCGSGTECGKRSLWSILHLLSISTGFDRPVKGHILDSGFSPKG